MSLGVAIVAGGEGRRLAPVTNNGPKALAPFAGKTLLDHHLDNVAALHPDVVVVLVHHHHREIQQHVGGRAQCIVEDRPMGTAGGLSLLPEQPDKWLVINVDHISDVSLQNLVTQSSGPCTAVLTSTTVVIDEGVVTVSEDRVVDWRERPALSFDVTTGLYVFSRQALSAVLNGGHCDMPQLVRSLMPVGVVAWHHDGTWFDAGTPQRLAQAEAWWRSQQTMSTSQMD